MLLLWSRSLKPNDESVELLSAGVGERRTWWTELLLLSDGNSGVSPCRLLEKNELLDAVIGVVGVLGSCLEGGGLNVLLRALPDSCSAAILLVVGVLNGPKLMGGNLKGCKCFLPWGVPLFSASKPTLVGTKLFRALGLRWSLVGSGNTGMEILPVELELFPKASMLLKAVFFFSIK